MSVELVISGGQTGADMAGLMAARALDIKTGGWAPKGWLTENGTAQMLLQAHGLHEYRLKGYPARTKANVGWADTTIIFSEQPGPGSRLTRKYCANEHKPYLLVHHFTHNLAVGVVRDFLKRTQPTILNIAGSRESKAKGIHIFVYDVLREALA